jgi:hypothetical protein
MIQNNKVMYSALGCTKINLPENSLITLPDFTIKNLGKTLPQPVNGRILPLGPTYHFEIINDNEKKVITWSSGTGHITPTLFVFQNAHFSLEKSFANYIERFDGQLGEDEVVICKINSEKMKELGGYKFQ